MNTIKQSVNGIPVKRHQKIISKLLREKYATNFFNNFESVKNFLNSKIKMDTGKYCNARCSFCYYYDSLKDDDRLTLDNVKNTNLENVLINTGMIEFSGGEPTLVKDLPDIMNYLISKKYYLTKNDQLYFGIVTNGTNLKGFIEALKSYEKMYLIGRLSSVLISLHGSKSVHDNITKLNGSYDKIRIAVNYLRRTYPNILVRINIVLTGQDIDKEFLELLKSYVENGIQINLLPLNFWEDTKIEANYDKIYNDVNTIMDYIYSNSLTVADNNYKSKYGAHLVNIRYIRLCKLDPKYHKFAVNHFDHLFDKLDWNKVWYPKYKHGINIYPNKKLTKESLIEAYVRDAEVSHYIGDICKSCPDFKNLKCDGLKYIDQENHIVDSDLEDFQFRTNYINKRELDAI